MTTKSTVFFRLRFFFISYTYVFVDARSLPLPVGRNQRRTTRSLAASRRFTGNSPQAQSLACHRVQRQPPLPSLAPACPIRPALSEASPNPGRWHRQSRGYGRQGASAVAMHHAQVISRTRGERGVSVEATAEHTRRKTKGAGKKRAAPARGRQSTPGEKRHARARGTRRQLGGGRAHQAQIGQRALPARGRLRSAEGAQWQPRASGAARNVDGRRCGRRPTPPLPPVRREPAWTRLCPRRAGRPFALAHCPEPRARVERNATGKRRIQLIKCSLPAALMCDHKKRKCLVIALWNSVHVDIFK